MGVKPFGSKTRLRMAGLACGRAGWVGSPSLPCGANLMRAEELVAWPLGPCETQSRQGGTWSFRSYNTVIGLLPRKAPVSRWLGAGDKRGGRAFRLKDLKVKALRWDWMRRRELSLFPLYT